MIVNSLVCVLRIIEQGILGQPGCCWWWWFSLQVVSASLIPWAVARQAPLSMGFSRQEYCSGVPFPSPGDLPDPVIKPMSLGSPALLEDSLLTDGFFSEPSGKPLDSMWWDHLTAQYVGKMVPVLMIIILLARMQWRDKGSDIFQRGFGAPDCAVIQTSGN